MLNLIWLSFFGVATLAALSAWLLDGDAEIWSRLTLALFDMAKLGFETSLGLIGILALWMGLLRIAEEAGAMARLARLLSPLLCRLMPGVPKDHPAFGFVTLNMAANILGLDNAATPVGLKAMHALQELNPQKDTASNAQILFLVLNASSLTLLPVTVFMFRAQFGAADPTSVFVPILIATSASTLAGLLSVAWAQKLRLLDGVLLAWFAGIALGVGGLATLCAALPPASRAGFSSLAGHLLLWGVVMGFLIAGWAKRVPVYETFIDGAKHGFEMGVRLIPYLVAMLVGVGVLRASGALDALLDLVRHGAVMAGWDTRFVDALPTAFMKPFSGSGARALMIETMQTQGVDSFAARLAAIIQGSTETTFYVLAVYFGAVGIRRARHAVACALIADLAGVLAAIAVAYAFFG